MGCRFCIRRTVALGDEEKALSAQNRNFKGRMRDNIAEMCMSSVETAAMSAIRGEICDPRDLF
ncbi:MAG: hypothetical protein C4B59_03840 [Candidatus Methanogaster sp.]|uniref:Uncharacterized protein n=1 Tax=Candidatus Methanogaster sp. TaxID=3386292 RepID=A0AC61L542_9EURY|nr:MAG: hypothetical protein C4B59_03840 [ANME-2 cluster archaeon]